MRFYNNPMQLARLNDYIKLHFGQPNGKLLNVSEEILLSSFNTYDEEWKLIVSTFERQCNDVTLHTLESLPDRLSDISDPRFFTASVEKLSYVVDTHADSRYHSLLQRLEREKEFASELAPYLIREFEYDLCRIVDDLIRDEIEAYQGIEKPTACLASFDDTEDTSPPRQKVKVSSSKPVIPSEQRMLTKRIEKPAFSVPNSNQCILLDESFSRRIQRLMMEKNMTPPECYRRAQIDRRLFSKICSSNDYHPKKSTVLALAIALKLTLEETNDLLSSAGYTLSHSFLFDVIVEFYIKEKVYDVMKINEVLYEYDETLLGS